MLLAALRCEKGTLAANLVEHERVLRSAREAGCTLAVFPEMSLTGSVDPDRFPGRLLTLDDPAVGAMVALTAEVGVAAVFGISERDASGSARITQVVANRGAIVGVQRKRHLGDDEVGYRAADDDTVFEIDGDRFAIAICAEAEIDRPFAFAQELGAAFVCFCAAPGLDGRRTTEAEWQAGWDWWLSAGLHDAKRHARAHGLWIAIAGQAGSTVDEDFPGLAALVDPGGDVVTQLSDWREGSLVVEVPV